MVDVDPGVHATQLTTVHQAFDAGGRQASREQLTAGDDPALVEQQPRDGIHEERVARTRRGETGVSWPVEGDGGVAT